MEDLYRLSQAQIEAFNKVYRRCFLKKLELNHRFCILLGQRGIGKTTAMVQHLMDLVGNDRFSNDILYVQTDHFLIQSRSLYDIAEQFHGLGGKIICFDEIHNYPNWSMELKSIYDTFTDMKILASGSSALEIYKGSHDLSRRALQLQMWGLSFREYLEMSTGAALPAFSLKEILDNHMRAAHEIIGRLGDKKVLPLFKAYLRHGHYPFYFENRNEALFVQLLNQNFHTIIERDLLAAHPALTGNSIKKITGLMRIISESVPFIPDYKKLAKLTDIGDQRTLKTYLKYLEDGCVVMGLSRSGKGLRGLEKPDKIFLNNTNLINAFTPNANVGTIRETYFMNMLSPLHRVTAPRQGDFQVDGVHLFEVGGRGKTFSQIKNQPNSYLAIDDMERGAGKKIPLWLFGCLY